AGIPVSTVGLGSESRPANLALRFKEPPRKAPAGETLSLSVTATNQGEQAFQTEVEFYAGEQLMESRAVEIPAGGELRLDFESMPDIQGFQTYRARLKETPANDLNAADDTAYAAVEITAPERLEVLYLSNQIDYNFRF